MRIFQGVTMTELNPIYDLQAAKKAVNLRINSDLVKKAKDLGINLSSVLEATLIDLVKQKQRENWINENQDAIEEYNQRIENDGVFSDGERKF